MVLGRYPRGPGVPAIERAEYVPRNILCLARVIKMVKIPSLWLILQNGMSMDRWQA